MGKFRSSPLGGICDRRRPFVLTFWCCAPFRPRYRRDFRCAPTRNGQQGAFFPFRDRRLLNRVLTKRVLKAEKLLTSIGYIGNPLNRHGQREAEWAIYINQTPYAGPARGWAGLRIWIHYRSVLNQVTASKRRTDGIENGKGPWAEIQPRGGCFGG
jgi:hypothetical protein